ncbi:hypothetical protein BLNAU_14072 [Blattamonas nauphoetae]|uniref:Right handed beta helix domain-containing protein n=1 Tax=Blattamonas nauphoetae TaxID=2049346 RepID=A0ABQ9XJJ7_9EUKA|nr:hypothetical protein BLNAU_14072 [Blattamonas nauphoetae]
MWILLLVIPILLTTEITSGMELSLFSENIRRIHEQLFGEQLASSSRYTLNNDLMISSTIQVRSKDMMLDGGDYLLLFAEYPRKNSEERLFRAEQTPNNNLTRSSEISSDRPDIGLQFMFDVWNSTFAASHVHAIVDSGRRGFCSLSSSTIRFSSSSIASSGLCSPFVVRVSAPTEQNLASTIVLSSITHISITSKISPLVGISGSPQSSDDLSSYSDCEISVTGIDLILSDTTLSSGTGPLFTFGLAQQSRQVSVGHVLNMETTMISSMLVNMSSLSAPSRRNSEETLVGSNVNQKMVGCSVLSSGNHQRGTSMLDPNMGGSLRCQNTSFSSCITESNAEQEIVRKDHTQGAQFTSAAVTSPTVVFRLCTFNNMISTTTGNQIGGAGIFLKLVASSLEVSQCFFRKCVITGANNDGGAILFTCSTTNKKPFRVEKSSFTECQLSGNHNTSTSGAFLIVAAQSSTVTDSFFRRCNATGRCGTVYLYQTAATLSNCVFVECASLKSYGAAIGRDLRRI